MGTVFDGSEVSKKPIGSDVQVPAENSDHIIVASSDDIVSDSDDVGIEPVYNYTVDGNRIPYTNVRDAGDNDPLPALQLMHGDSEAMARLRDPNDTELRKQFTAEAESFSLLSSSQSSAVKAATGKEANWVQGIQVPDINRKLNQVYVATDNGTNPVQRIVDHINAKVTGTMPAYVPLFNSGLWLRLAPITLPQINDFVTSHSENTQELGYATDGQVFSAISGVFQKAIVDFILQSVVMCSANIPVSELKAYIKQTDYAALIAGAAGTIFSKGFNYSHRCIAANGDISHVTTGLMNPRDIVWYDDNKISKEARGHMNEAYDSIRRAFAAYRSGKSDAHSHLMAAEKVTAYQKKNEEAFGNQFSSGAYSGTLRVPSLRDMEEHTDLWINAMKDSAAYRELKRADPNDPGAARRRARFLERQATAARLSRLSMYFDSISCEQENDELITTNTREGIIEVLDALSASKILGDDQTLESIGTRISDFMAEASYTMVGIPSFTCTKCGVPQERVHAHSGDSIDPLRSLVPVQPDIVFFRLMLWVYQKMAGA